MRVRAVGLIAVLLASGAALAQFEERYLAQANRTELWAPSFAKQTADNIAPGEILVGAFTNFTGKRPSTVPGAVAIAVRAVSEGQVRLAHCHGVEIAADSNVFKLPRAQHTAIVAGGSFVESFRAEASWSDFAAISRASIVELRICDMKLKVGMQRLLEWRALVRAGTPPRPGVPL